jgi:hypothetical protein
MDTDGTIILDLWELIVEHIPNNKREDVANKVIKIFADAGFEAADFETVRGEDSHLDAAIDNIKEEVDDDEYDFEAEDYEDD